MSLVRARIGDRSVTVGAVFAESNGLEVLDEPTHLDDGQLRPETTLAGRPLKPKTTVAEAAVKKAGQPTAATPPPSKEH